MNFKNEVFNSFSDIWRLSIVSVEGKPITVGSIVIGLFFLILGIYLSKKFVKKFVDFSSDKFNLDKSSKYLLELILFYLSLSIVVLFSLKLANIPITIFTLLGGAVAIGLGFGSQTIINNFLSGLVIILERPIKVGDFVNNDGILSEVESIGLRSTKLKSFGNQHVFIPNSKIIDSQLVNYTYKNNIVRTGVNFGISYNTDIGIIGDVILTSLKKHNKILSSPNPKLIFINFGDSSLDFRIEFSLKINNVDDKRFIESDVRYMLFSLFKKHNISIPFPQRDLHINYVKKIDETLGPNTQLPSS